MLPLRLGKIVLAKSNFAFVGHYRRLVPPPAALSTQPVLQERLPFQALYERYFASTWRMLKYLGLPPSQLDDGAQELWVVVHRRYAQFEGRSDIRSWLFAIAVNVERNFRRAERRRGPLVALPSELHARHGDPALDHEAREAWGLMLGFVETLDETRRTVFVASLLEGLSAAETAEVTGLDETTVYNRVRALRRSFQLWIKQHRSEP